MYYRGVSAIDHLSNRISETDPGESSHWRKFHSAFHFSGKGFSGLNGFGGNDPSWRSPLHKLMQRPYRMLGRELQDFKALDEVAENITSVQRRAYDIDVLRQSLTVSFLRGKLRTALGENSVGCVIGDGFATTASLLLSPPTSARCVVLVNLTKTLLVDLWYLKLWMRDAFDAQVCLVTDDASVVQAFSMSAEDSGLPRVVAIQAKDHNLIRHCPIDYVINIASMQEMNPPVIAEYFEDIRSVAAERDLYFYCANREEKFLPDGTMTRFIDYPWLAGDKVIVDENCPWHQTFYTFRPPFYRQYDGPIRHKLIQVQALKSRLRRKQQEGLPA